MTRQTTKPIPYTSLAVSARSARELARFLQEGWIDLDPPYQRGHTWTEAQRVELVRSWMLGLLGGLIILSNRANPDWIGTDSGDSPSGDVIWGLVDGKQRLTAARAFFEGELPVPASWFEPDLIVATEPTDDGPYVRYTQLTRQGQLEVNNRAMFGYCEVKTARTVKDEAAIYVLVNSAGTAQTSEDLDRARAIAAGRPS